MGVAKVFGIFTPICDCCGDELADEFDYFDAIDAMRTAGWCSEETDFGWDNYCEDCSTGHDFDN